MNLIEKTNKLTNQKRSKKQKNNNKNHKTKENIKKIWPFLLIIDEVNDL